MADIAFSNGTQERVGLKLTDRFLIENIDTKSVQYTEVQDLPFATQSALSAEATARAAIKNSFPVYNLTERHPLSSGYYAAAGARAAVPTAIRKKGLVITYAIAANNWITEQFFQGEVSAWTTAGNWHSVDGPDVLVADSMADLRTKLDDSDWWLNGHSITDKIMIRQIRVITAGWTFTLIVTRSNFLTQYLIGPTKLLPDDTFEDDTAYYESYILKRTIVGTAGKWHYVDRPDFLNVDAYKPLTDGYYTAETARAAIPTSARKKGQIITYATAANAWAVEQFFQGETSAWATDANWKPISTNYSSQISELNGRASILEKTTFKYAGDATDEIRDGLLTPGAYYLGTEETNGGIKPPAQTKELILVVGTRSSLIIGDSVKDVTQYRFRNGVFDFRIHYTAGQPIGNQPGTLAYWEEWKNPFDTETEVSSLFSPAAGVTVTMLKVIKDVNGKVIFSMNASISAEIAAGVRATLFNLAAGVRPASLQGGAAYQSQANGGDTGWSVTTDGVFQIRNIGTATIVSGTTFLITGFYFID